MAHLNHATFGFNSYNNADFERLRSRFVWDKKTVLWELCNVSCSFGLPLGSNDAHNENRSGRMYNLEGQSYSQEYESLLDYDFINSHKFNAGCHPENYSNWSVSLCKRFNPSFIGIFLHLLAIENESQVNCRRSTDESFETTEYEGLFIRYAFSAVSQTGAILKRFENPSIVHIKIGDSWGEDNFIPCHILKDPNSHYILDDTLRIKVDLWIFQDCNNEIYRHESPFYYGGPHDQYPRNQDNQRMRSRKNFYKYSGWRISDTFCFEKQKSIDRGTNTSSPVLASLWQTREFADVTIKCGDETIQVHKCLLCAASPVFKAMFTSQMDENLRNEIVITDSTSEVMVAFVHYIYKGNLPDDWRWDNIDSLSELLNACEKYQVLELKNACGTAIIDYMTIQNVGKAAILVNLFFPENTNLTEAVYSFIVRNLVKLRENKSFQTALETHPAAFSKCLLSASMKNIIN